MSLERESRQEDTAILWRDATAYTRAGNVGTRKGGGLARLEVPSTMFSELLDTKVRERDGSGMSLRNPAWKRNSE